MIYLNEKIIQKQNWVDDILIKASQEVDKWPSWMRKRELCYPVHLNQKALRDNKDDVRK